MRQLEIMPYAEDWRASVERLCARIWGPERSQYRYGGHLHLQTSLWDMSIAGRSFLSKHGFQEIRRTYETSFDVASAAGLDRWDDSLARDGAAMIPYNRLDTDERQALALLSRQCYAETHTVNPVGEIGVTRWAELIESDVMAEGSFVVMKNHAVIAYALMHRRESGAAELGWRGVCAGEREHTRRWIVELTARQVRYAKELGLERLYAEIDTTDVWALPMLDFFPFEPVPAWVTYQR
ncbi:hypothetical protein E2R60_11295 [Paenibacillus dendritiformis]|uniref:hypothetical protein n=1 Tax=Paenibacillus dendritiformis TaxID=130049 RepID=UPI00105A6AC6|nr:hypothetical protein [Paenibacillus dendritiformis]TDL56094.1 hypothetical protein E2R60_11295 [Paenibacillus dendritiformis]